MHRPGADPVDLNPEDFWCDFCRRPWSDQVPFVEGHRGSCICGNCLSMAWIAVETDDPELVRGEFFCVMSQNPPPTEPPRTVAMTRAGLHPTAPRL